MKKDILQDLFIDTALDCSKEHGKNLSNISKKTEPTFERIVSGSKPCKWCQSLAIGKVKLSEISDDHWKRHSGCKCLIKYNGDETMNYVDGKKLNVDETEPNLEEKKKIFDKLNIITPPIGGGNIPQWKNKYVVDGFVGKNGGKFTNINRAGLEHHEYESVKRLVANGKKVEWIKLPEYKTQNDLKMDGLKWEMKTSFSKAKRTFKRRMDSAFKNKYPNIIFDLSNMGLNKKQATSYISKYRTNNPTKKIRNLLILYKNEKIETIIKNQKKIK
jgi:hypothetical protein